MIPTTLVAGADAGARERAIAAALDGALHAAAILEGLPASDTLLETRAGLDVSRIAAGCPCCQGNLVLRVTLNRVLQKRPDRLFIALASLQHLAALRDFLASAPYSRMLALTQDLLPPSRSQ